MYFDGYLYILCKDGLFKVDEIREIFRMLGILLGDVRFGVLLLILEVIFMRFMIIKFIGAVC